MLVWPLFVDGVGLVLVSLGVVMLQVTTMTSYMVPVV